MKKRDLYARWRFALFVLHDFRWPLLVVIGLTLGGGWLLSVSYTEKQLSYVEASYDVYQMLFLRSPLPLPGNWTLQVFFFLLPIIGLAAVGDSMARVGYLVFTSKRRLQEWHIMEASLRKNHIVVVGAGHVGYRIVKDLLGLKEEVVVIDSNLDSPLVLELLDLGVTTLQGSAQLRRTLEQAGIARAKAIIVATGSDLTNLDVAIIAREIRADIRVVLRLFDETLAKKVAPAFEMLVVSTSATSAPAFIAAATQRSVFAGFRLDGAETLHVADVSVDDGSALAGSTVGELQRRYGVNVIMHRRSGAVTVNPEHDVAIQSTDRVLVVAPIERITELCSLLGSNPVEGAFLKRRLGVTG